MLKEQEYFLSAPNKEKKWCSEHFLQRKTLSEVKEVIHDLTRRLEEHKIYPNSHVRAPHQRRDAASDPAQEQLLLKVPAIAEMLPLSWSCPLIEKHGSKYLQYPAPVLVA